MTLELNNPDRYNDTSLELPLEGSAGRLFVKIDFTGMEEEKLQEKVAVCYRESEFESERREKETNDAANHSLHIYCLG